MEKYFLFMIAVGAAVVLVGGIVSMYQLFRLVETDSECRGLRHPKLWGMFAVTGNHSAGLLFYLINRRKHPILSMTDGQRTYIGRCKKKIGVGITCLVIGAMVCIWGAVLI